MPPKKRKVVSRSRHVDRSKVGRRSASRRVHTGTVEAKWDCTSCGTKDIPGFTKVCPGCNNPRDADETYQPPADRKTAKLLSTEELRNAGVTSDHYSDQQCGYCGYFSQPGTARCPHCTANLEDVAYTSRKCPSCDHETNKVTCSVCGSTTESSGSDDNHTVSRPSHASPSYKRPLRTRTSQFVSFDGFKSSNFKWLAITLAVIGLIAFIFWPRHAKVSVNDASWVYTVYLQEYQYNAHEDWNLPATADKTGEESRIHHYDTIIDGYHEECHYEREVVGSETVSDTETVCENVYSHTETTTYDDGSTDYHDVYTNECHQEPVTRQQDVYGDVEHCEQVADTHEEPRYATWYFYQIWEWVNLSPAVASEHNYEPYWPTGYLIDEKHRESGREEEYSISLATEDNNKSFSLSPDSLDEYRQYPIGSSWTITHSGGVITEIEPAQ
jgi:hypothetical protein